MASEEIEVLGALFIGAEDDMLATDEEIGGSSIGFLDNCVVGSLFDDVGSFLRGAAKTVGKVVKSPIVRETANGVALAYPQSAPVKEGLALADRAVRTAEGLRGSPKQQQLMRKVIGNTVKLAKAGDASAQRAAEYLATAVKVRRSVVSTVTATAAGAAAHARGKPSVVKDGRASGGILVKRGGVIKRGNFIAT